MMHLKKMILGGLAEDNKKPENGKKVQVFSKKVQVFFKYFF